MKGKATRQRFSDAITVGFLFALLLTIFGSPLHSTLIWSALVVAAVFVIPSIVAGFRRAAEWSMDQVVDRALARREGCASSLQEENAVVPAPTPEGRDDEVSPGA